MHSTQSGIAFFSVSFFFENMKVYNLERTRTLGKKNEYIVKGRETKVIILNCKIGIHNASKSHRNGQRDE